MSDAAKGFVFGVGDRVQFKDGRQVRTAFVMEQHLAEVIDDRSYPQGYTVRFFMQENGQIRLTRWDEKGLTLAGENVFEFAEGARVKVDLDDGDGIVGQVVGRAPATAETLNNHYGVAFKDADGRSQIAWWDEYLLVAAKG